jgi:hypothetical protein
LSQNDHHRAALALQLVQQELPEPIPSAHLGLFCPGRKPDDRAPVLYRLMAGLPPTQAGQPSPIVDRQQPAIVAAGLAHWDDGDDRRPTIST